MNLLHLILVFLMIAGLSLSVYGFQKKSQIIMLIGGIGFFGPLFYFMGWTSFLPFVSVIALGISFLGRKKTTST